MAKFNFLKHIGISFLIFINFPSFSTQQSQCQCRELINRRIITDGDVCGLCARYFFDLYYFYSSFPNQAPSIGTPPIPAPATDFENKYKACSENIPYLPSFQPATVCVQNWRTAQDTVNVFFSAACAQALPTLQPPPTVNTANLEAYKKMFSRKPDDPFVVKRRFDPNNNTNDFYTAYCPSELRRYEFTFYMLFAEFVKMYGRPTTPVFPPSTTWQDWNEDFGLPQIAKALQQTVLQKQIKDTRELFDRFGYNLKSPTDKYHLPRRFCGHSDVFICID